MRRGPSKHGLRVVALFEAAKGLLVLLVGFGILALIHKDLHAVAEQLVRHFHLNPASRYPGIFIDITQDLTNRYLWAMVASALLYSAVRLVEAYGLWHQRQWAEWFGLLTGAMYVPIEVFEIIRKVTWPRVTVFAVNAAIVAYLSYVLYESRHRRRHSRPKA